MDKFIKLKTLLPHRLINPVSDLLMGIGAESVSEDITNIQKAELSSYFPVDTEIENKILIIENFISDIYSEYKADGFNLKFSWDYVDSSSWEHWKSYLKTVKASKRVVIKPPWEIYNQDQDKYVVEINPSVAFGTGHHETTTICIKFLDEIIAEHKNIKVLDVGCGSGILGITSVILGAKSATCIDNDFKATRETKLNSKRNNVEVKVSAVNGLIGCIVGKFDLIVSNIYAETLIDLKETFKERIKKNGFLVLSGIMCEKKQSVIKNYRLSGFTYINEKNDGNWTGLLFSMN